MRFGFLADDFTGASDVLLQCRRGGMDAAIVGDLARDAQSTSFDGLASTIRAMTPAELSGFLPAVLEEFSAIGTDVLLYKVCSTFDSSPELGSIGLAVKLLREHLHDRVPIIVVPAQPGFGRFTVFGHHFAVSDDKIYRLDRHPVMSQHPATPMRESDLGLILEQQGITADRVRRVTLRELRQETEKLARLMQQGAEYDVILVDALEDSDLDLIAGEIIKHAHGLDHILPVIGSGGIAGALARSAALSEPLKPQEFPPGPTLILSGSRSPVTQRQIEHVVAAGWKTITLDGRDLLSTDTVSSLEVDEVVELLQSNNQLIVTLAEGSADGADIVPSELARASGQLFAELIRACVAHVQNCRIAVLGGDTSSWTISSLEPARIEVAAEFVQAGPILNISAPGVPTGTPFLLKGGQVGSHDTLVSFASI